VRRRVQIIVSAGVAQLQTETAAGKPARAALRDILGMVREARKEFHDELADVHVEHVGGDSVHVPDEDGWGEGRKARAPLGFRTLQPPAGESDITVEQARTAAARTKART
jgi:hypothetical protein